MVEIKEIVTRREIKEFIKFPEKLYRDEPNWVPEIFMDEMNNLDRKKNPAFDYCEAKYFMAYRDGESVGRIAAILSHKANETWKQNRMRFSRVDFIDDDEVVDALFNAVESWAREKGCDEVHGPIGFCDLDKEGMLVEGFDHPSLFITLYHFPYYLKQLTRCGYAKDVDWVEYRVFVPKELDPKLERISDIVLRRQKLTLFHYENKKQLKPIIKDVFRLINEAYHALYGVVALSERQISHYTSQYLPFVQPEFLTLVMDKENKLCAFGLMVPSMGEAVRKARGRFLPFGWIYLLKALRARKVLDMLLVAIRPSMQNMGIDAVIMTEMIRSAHACGVEYAETGPELESNIKVQGLWKNFETVQHKRRRCFLKKLD